MHNIFWALLILFAVAALLRMDWVYYLVYVVGGVWIFSHLWIRHNLSRLEVKRELAARAFTGETLAAHLFVNNRGWLPLPWLQIQEAVPLELKDQADYRSVVSVGSRSTLDYAYVLRCKKRGYYAVGPLSLRTSDLFGFVEGRWEETAPARLIVYPEVIPLEQMGLPSRSPFGTMSSRQRLLEDPARLAGVRDYQSGDSLRRVHWKATAHMDTLLVKKLQPSMAVPVTLVLDLNRNAYPTRSAIGSSEWAIVVTASVASAMIAARQPVGLASNGLDPLAQAMAAPLGQRNGQEHLMAILSLLARIQLQATAQDLATWLPSQITGVPWGTTLVVVTPQVDKRALWTLHDAYRRGSNVVVLVCATQPGFTTIQAHAGRLGITLHSVVWESELRVAAAADL